MEAPALGIQAGSTLGGATPWWIGWQPLAACKCLALPGSSLRVCQSSSWCQKLISGGDKPSPIFVACSTNSVSNMYTYPLGFSGSGSYHGGTFTREHVQPFAGRPNPLCLTLEFFFLPGIACQELIPSGDHNIVDIPPITSYTRVTYDLKINPYR